MVTKQLLNILFIIIKTDNMKISGLLFIVLLLGAGCDRLHSDDIIGSWTNARVEGEVITLERKDKPENEYTITFREGGKLTERKNAGWCGTPPVSYADFEGTWQQTDSLINIEVGYWGGREQYRWIILSVDRKNLSYIPDTVIYITTE
jgi:hypothetical protein